MAQRDMTGDLDPRFGLRDLLGLRGGMAWLFMLILELIIVLYMIGNLQAASLMQTLVALVVMAAAGAVVLLAPEDPLPWTSTAFVTAAGPVATALTAVDLGSAPAHHVVWTAYACSYVLAALVLRGRIAAAWLSVAASATVLVTAGLRIDVRFDAIVSASIVPIGTVAAISAFAVIIRPTQRSLRMLREEATVRAAAEATMVAADGERIRQLARLDRVARPILERIADGAVLTAAEREQCRLLEAELRDGLRAPQLVTEELSGAARGARARGVEVVLLDDGGFEGVPQWVRQRVIDSAVRELDAANAGSVTVRVLPLGRRVLATVLAHAAEDDRRTEIDTDGNVAVTT
ncbi:hypothetical protein [Nocardia macrotermitis]|uniref:Uncharacterized protein n=1 Tax=Nocardia macrotermitis TaxID=2585198 RepID=A0A7K0D0Q6_9NOCA|nr:hypothetical protein [Nocardia macrotermitis]MQY18812.1 hypothetical protein [Nocardia macrotermitis]